MYESYLMLYKELLTEMAGLGAIDWLITLTALIYVSLSAINSPWGWPFGIISCALWGYVSYYDYNLYLDALLQLFYVGMGFWGLYLWTMGGQKGREIPITRLSTREHLVFILAGSIIAMIFGYLFSEYTAAAATYQDAFTTVFSIIATFLLVKRHIENWLYWIVVDIMYIDLYWSRGAVLFSLLMLIYTIIATLAYKSWRKKII